MTGVKEQRICIKFCFKHSKKASEPQPKMWQKFDTEGMVPKEIVPPGRMVNGKFYCDVLRQLRENIWCKLPDKWHNNSWALHCDNAPAHASLAVRQFLASTNMTVIPHPPYLQDLAICDFFLFPKMKFKLKGRHYDSTEQIQIKLQNVMKKLTQNDFQKCFLSWKSHWNRCISAEGDYFKGNGGE
jgi:hypothetical protein